MQAMIEYGDYFVGWGTLSLINAGLAQAKGRSGLLWWYTEPSRWLRLMDPAARLRSQH
jgi:hypothetical protein